MAHKAILNYDEHSDILYIVTKKGTESDCVEIAPGISIELDAKGKAIGIEILNASAVLKPIAKPLYHHMHSV